MCIFTGSPSPAPKRSGRHSEGTNESLDTKNIPFPELSHHPLNTDRSRNSETEPQHSKNHANEQRQNNMEKLHQPHTRVTTYV